MKLSVIKNSKIIQVIELDPEIEFPQVYLVGRSSHCHMVLNDNSLSREQGQFILENSKLTYKENASGKVINIMHGQSLKLGTYEIKFENPKQISTEVKKNEEPIILDMEPKTEKITIQPVEQNNEINLSESPSYEKGDLQTATLANDVVQGSEKMEEQSLENNDFNEEMIKETFNLPETVQEEIKDEKAFNLIGENDFAVTDANDDATRVMQDFVQYELHLSGPNVPFEKYQINKPETTVGRSQKADIILLDQEVSSFHAKFNLKNNTLSIEDTGSVNGITVNNKKVNKQSLAEGDSITIGNVVFKVSVSSEFIEGEKNILMPVDVYTDDKTQEFVLDDIARSSSEFEKEKVKDSNAKSGQFDFIKNILGNIPLDQIRNNQKRVLLYGTMLVLILILLYPEGEEVEQQVVVDNAKQAAKDNSSIASNNHSKQAGNEQKDKSSPEINQPQVDEKSPEELNYLNSHYALALSYIEKGDYVTAISEIDLILKVDKDFKDVASLYGIAKDGLAKVEEEERKRKEEEERIARKKEVEELIVKIETAMKERNLNSSEMYISQVLAIDPENLKVSSLKLEIEAIKEDIRKRAEEEAIKMELRAKMVARLAPGKSFYHQKEWFKAIVKLSDFLNVTGSDEDLIKEASLMLEESKKNLDEQITGPLDKARQYKLSQDLKNAYENYNDVLRIYPTHEESLVAAREIKEVLMSRAKVVFRQALVSESISHFRKAKEKFQEVLLIAPSDSEYYKKAEDKLKKIYLE